MPSVKEKIADQLANRRVRVLTAWSRASKAQRVRGVGLHADKVMAVSR